MVGRAFGLGVPANGRELISLPGPAAAPQPVDADFGPADYFAGVAGARRRSSPVIRSSISGLKGLRRKAPL